jgi:serine/threonine protein kinase
VLSSLAHPNVVRYESCFAEGGRHYICQELCEGGDLEHWLKARAGAPLPEHEVGLKFVQLCLALQHVHAKVGNRCGMAWRELGKVPLSGR